MPGRKKNAVRKGRGSMCNICGKNCGRGGPLKVHLKGAHNISYEDYKKCFKGGSKIITDSWDISGKTRSGKDVIIHVLVRKFVGDAGERGVRKTAK
jgi:hypothetical protein